MKKELFDRVVNETTKQFPLHKLIEQDDFISAMFLTNPDNGGIKIIGDQIKAKVDHSIIRTSMTEKRFDFPWEINDGDMREPKKNVFYQKKFLCIKYTPSKNKISVSEFTTGYGWSRKKSRYYPMSKTEPKVCFSKNIYVFKFKGGKPRLFKGYNLDFHNKPIQNIIKMFLGIEYAPKLPILAKYLFNTKDEWSVLETMYKVQIPKRIKKFSIHDVELLLSVLKNPNEITSFNMFLAKENVEVGTVRNNISGSLHRSLSKMMIGETIEYLIADWMRDLKDLKLKTTLKITSRKRIEDEHRRFSKMRMMKGIKEIKVVDCYKEMFKKFPIENAELITNKKRLLQESIDQDHCVATYADRINRGECCIISLPYQGEQWTLQINQDMILVVGQDGIHHQVFNFKMQQLKGKLNKSSPLELDDIIRNWCKSLPVTKKEVPTRTIELPTAC